jgi:hypothetical protein
VLFIALALVLQSGACSLNLDPITGGLRFHAQMEVLPFHPGGGFLRVEKVSQEHTFDPGDSLGKFGLVDLIWADDQRNSGAPGQV